MRMLPKAVVDTEAGSEAPRTGSLAKISGRRAMFVVFDMAESSRLPAISEPLFAGATAEVTLTPCMNVDDLMQGRAHLPPELTFSGS